MGLWGDLSAKQQVDLKYLMRMMIHSSWDAKKLQASVKFMVNDVITTD